MRTTIDLPEDQHRALSALAARRGLRGFSPLIQEALAVYLQHLDLDEVDLLLTLEGSMSEHDELRLRTSIDEAWSAWRAS